MMARGDQRRSPCFSSITIPSVLLAEAIEQTDADEICRDDASDQDYIAGVAQQSTQLPGSEQPQPRIGQEEAPPGT
jgi:hypothetical protein